MSRVRRAAGSVLIAVLGGLLLVGAITFAAVFTVTLDALSARSAADGARVDAELEGALNAAVAELAALGPSPALPVSVGPWPALGIEARVRLSAAAADGVLLEAELPGTRRRATLVVVLEPGLTAVWRP